MMRAQSQALKLLCSALALGCASDKPRNDTEATVTSTTDDLQTGLVTSAPGGATVASDSAPTMATALLTALDTEISTSEACNSLCQDMPAECDVWEQDCPEGQKCAAYVASGSGWNAARCVEVTGMDKPGDPCSSEGAETGIDSCIKGAMCWRVSQDGAGICVALCTGGIEAPVCEPSGDCAIAADGYLILCITDCDPLLQDCPNPAEACYEIDHSFNCLPNNSGADGQANDICEFSNTCDAGLMCDDSDLVGMGCTQGSTNCCTPFCKFPDGSCPNPDQQCVQYFDPMQLPPNDPNLDIGVCGVPS